MHDEPTSDDLTQPRAEQIRGRLRETARGAGLEAYRALVEDLCREDELEPEEVAAAALRLAFARHEARPESSERPRSFERPQRPRPFEDARRPAGGRPERGTVRLHLAVGHWSGVRPGDIVGAIANEAGVPGSDIGAIDIYDRSSFVELPERYRDQVLERMAGTLIRGRAIRIQIATPLAPRPHTGDRDAGARHGGGGRTYGGGGRPYGGAGRPYGGGGRLQGGSGRPFDGSGPRPYGRGTGSHDGPRPYGGQGSRPGEGESYRDRREGGGPRGGLRPDGPR